MKEQLAKVKKQIDDMYVQQRRVEEENEKYAVSQLDLQDRLKMEQMKNKVLIEELKKNKHIRK